MSARHLAPPDIQPATFAFSAENQAWAEKTIARYPAGRQQSAVIPILWRAQEQQGWVTRAAIETVARILGMAYIRVLEIATFYTQFLLKPVGSEAHIIVCGTTPCMLRGAGDLIEVCQHKIAHGALDVSADGKLSWEEAECLGACVNAPMVMIGNDTYEDLTAERFEQIVDAFRAGNGRSIKPGTQIDRQFSAEEGGRTTLLETPTAERTYKPFPPPAAPAAAAPAPAAAAPVVAPAPAPTAPPAAPVAPASSPAAAPVVADADEPTKRGRVREVDAEGAPAVKGPSKAKKVSEARVEADRGAVNDAAKANGEPNAAMREGATGAESPAGKIDGGKSPRKPRAKKASPPEGTT